MATLGSKLQTRQMEWHANMTDLNHLGKSLLVKPDKMQGVMNQIFTSQNYFSDNPLSSQLMGSKVTEKEINGLEWEWELKGASTRPLVVVENVEPASITQPGKFKRNFKIKLDEKWYKIGDYITPGTTNKKFQCRIQSNPTRHGDGWVYVVRLASDEATAFLPATYLKPGTPWGKLFSKYGEAAEQSGSTQFSMPIAFKNKLSKYRKDYRITDFASTATLAVGMQNEKGEKKFSWMRYADVEYWMQWYREIEKGFWYGRSTDSVIDQSTGRPVQSGPGVQEQLEDSHVHRYSELTSTLIEEFLMDIFYSRVKPGKGRKIHAYTGEYGMLQFHKAVQDRFAKSGFLQIVDDTFIQKSSSDYHSNALSFGFQYTTFKMANGIELQLIHNPLYDDREINFEIDPISGYPVESQRFTFLDFSGESGDSNVCIMNKKDGYTFNYINGLFGPTGPANGENFTSSHSGDYYEMHVGKVCGVHINDITKCGELILARN